MTKYCLLNFIFRLIYSTYAPFFLVHPRHKQNKMTSSADESSLPGSSSTTEISASSSAHSNDEFGDPYSFSTTLGVGEEEQLVAFEDESQFNSKYAHKIAELATEFLHEVSIEENWAQPRLLEQPGRLQVATSTLPYAPYCFRVEAQLNGDAEAAFALMHNLTERAAWDDMCDEIEVIEQLDPFTFIYRIRLKARWPTSARDSCSLVGFRKLKDGRFLSIAQSIEDERCPADPTGRVVRMNTRFSGNLFTPLRDGHFHLTQLLDADPKGLIPSALVKSVSSKSIPISMTKIEKAIAGKSGTNFYASLIDPKSKEAAVGSSSLEQLKKFETKINPKKEEGDCCAVKWLPIALSALNTLLLLVILKQINCEKRK